MPLNLQPKCLVCKLIQNGDTKLLKRLYNSSYYRGGAGEDQSLILKAYKGKFGRNTLWRHLKEHQALSTEDLQTAVARRVADKQVGNIIKDVYTADAARQMVIEKGMKNVKSGRAKVSAKDLLQATKQDADIKAKQTDQALLMQEMAFRFMSGEFVYDGNSGSNTEPVRNPIDVTA